jgi:hypothetical protein
MRPESPARWAESQWSRKKKGFADRDLEISDMTNNIRFLIYNIRLIYNIIYFMVL